MKISVIVPVYNVELYLSKCLDSLVHQTIESIEIIVVNDGSTDNSQKIIDEYKTKYPNKIKSYIKSNGGLSDARNYGIDKANGQYIGFVDSDDYVEINMFEKMYNKAISQNFDIVVCDVNCQNGNHNKRISSPYRAVREKATPKSHCESMRRLNVSSADCPSHPT